MAFFLTQYYRVEGLPGGSGCEAGDSLALSWNGEVPGDVAVTNGSDHSMMGHDWCSTIYQFSGNCNGGDCELPEITGLDLSHSDYDYMDSLTSPTYTNSSGEESSADDIGSFMFDYAIAMYSTFTYTAQANELPTAVIDSVTTTAPNGYGLNEYFCDDANLNLNFDGISSTDAVGFNAGIASYNWTFGFDNGTSYTTNGVAPISHIPFSEYNTEAIWTGTDENGNATGTLSVSLSVTDNDGNTN